MDSGELIKNFNQGRDMITFALAEGPRTESIFGG